MSRITSDTELYVCGNDHGLMEPCTGHRLYVEAHLSSDTVAVYVDGKTELVLDDAGYHALERAMKSLDEKWSVQLVQLVQKESDPVTMSEVPTIKVQFLSKRIRPDGEIGSLVISAGGSEIEITPEQAKSLAKTIMAKYGMDVEAKGK